jgi:hypothetical protein
MSCQYNSLTPTAIRKMIRHADISRPGRGLLVAGCTLRPQAPGAASRDATQPRSRLTSSQTEGLSDTGRNGTKQVVGFQT